MNEKEYYYRLVTKTSKISLSPKGFSFETLMFIYVTWICSIANITYDETLRVTNDSQLLLDYR